MIGLDTNVLVRYLVKDDPKQAEAAARVIRKASRQDEPLFVNHVVLCELVWVLESAYEYPKPDIVEVLEKLLMTKQLRIERKDDIWAALAAYRQGRGDFSDHLLGHMNVSHGCQYTVTFDTALKGSAAFRVL